VTDCRKHEYERLAATANPDNTVTVHFACRTCGHENKKVFVRTDGGALVEKSVRVNARIRLILSDG
jgi:hypothetical protein